MKNSKIITYAETHGKNNAPVDSVAIYQNGMLIEHRHIANMPFALKPDRSVFKKQAYEKQDLKQEKMLHKLSGNYNPRPESYITITQ